MRPFVKVFSAFLLLLNGTGALYGGWHLITDPTGNSLQMPVTWLEHSPFENYLIPGIVLLVANGVLSFVALSLLFTKPSYYSLALIVEGCVLLGWITTQMFLLRTANALQIAFTVTGCSMLLAGLILKRNFASN